ncbi:glutaredoxin 2 [Plakobranchus ocellatus]|uniref:Glutaredoxin-2, mitochondrial n=1 Tax=Plakobranchus ocellatus TaxID=259542 RepID=A0AAV3YWK2_9GAST|nr:glutaredoxin 2 [Plakobranchus ocellatus]
MDSCVDVPSSELTAQAKGDHGEGETKEQVQSDELNYIQDMVTRNKVVVFSKSHCPHCSDSKTLLTGMGVQYKTVELDELNNGGQLQNVLGSITDARTVPRIFIDGQCVGGNSDLKSLDKSGRLEDMLKRFKE